MNNGDIEAYRREKDYNMRHGMDYKQETAEEKQRRGFAEHDTTFDNNVLGIRIKTPGSDDSDNMPTIKSRVGNYDNMQVNDEKDKSRVT